MPSTSFNSLPSFVPAANEIDVWFFFFIYDLTSPQQGSPRQNGILSGLEGEGASGT